MFTIFGLVTPEEHHYESTFLIFFVFLFLNQNNTTIFYSLDLVGARRANTATTKLFMSERVSEWVNKWVETIHSTNTWWFSAIFLHEFAPLLSLRCDFIDRQLVVGVRMHASVVLHLIHVLFSHHFYIFLLQLESPRQAATSNIGTRIFRYIRYSHGRCVPHVVSEIWRPGEWSPCLLNL